MKKHFLITIILFLISTVCVQAQTFAQLWTKQQKASDDDLPKTELTVLKSIVSKATKEKSYGNLVAAQLRMIAVEGMIEPDSVEGRIATLRKLALKAEKNDACLAAVYYCALGNICGNAYLRNADKGELAKSYFAKALANKDALAREKASSYVPLMRIGKDSSIFADDLLSVIGFEAGAYSELEEYYLSHDNRHAAMICARMAMDTYSVKNKAAGVKGRMAILDSLERAYSGVPDLAIIVGCRAECMYGLKDVSTKDKYEYLTAKMAQYRSDRFVGDIGKVLDQIVAPSLSASCDGLAIQGKTTMVRLSGVRNIGKVTFNIYSTGLDGRATDYDVKEAKKKLVTTLERDYSSRQPYEQFSDSIALPSLPPGVYCIELTSSVKGVRSDALQLFVTGLHSFFQSLPDRKGRIVVTKADTGEPVQGARIETEGRGRGKSVAISDKLLTNADGELLTGELPDNGLNVFVTKGEDKALPAFNVWSYGSSSSGGKDVQHRVVIQTDRSIYRPGETICVALMAYSVTDGTETKAEGGVSMPVKLTNANYEKIADVTVTTDRYGHASASFTIPQKVKTGNFIIRCNKSGYYTNASVKVEEYKAPTYYIEYDDVKDAYRTGDTIIVRGSARTYSGMPVQGAKVKYSVNSERSLRYWWSNFLNGNVIVASDSAMTDADGRFEMRVPMLMSADGKTSGDDEDEDPDYGVMPLWKRPWMACDIVVKAEVTDIAGESHEKTVRLPLSSRSSTLSVIMDNQVEKSQQSRFTVYRLNAACKEMEGKVTCSVDGKSLKRTFEANREYDLQKDFPEAAVSGRHEIVFVCEGDTARITTVAFSMYDKKAPVSTDDWFYISDTSFPDDKTAVHLQMGTSRPETFIYYTITSEDKILENGVIRKGAELYQRDFIYRKEYGKGLSMVFAWVKDGKTYCHNVILTKPLPSKDLTMKWNTFRNKLVPGQKETWTLQVTRPDGKPADASLVATLYDKSLEQLVPHRFSFTLNRNIWLNSCFLYKIGNMYSNANLTLYDARPMQTFNFSTFDRQLYSDILTYGLAVDEMANGYMVFDHLEAPVVRKNVMIRGMSTSEPTAMLLDTKVSGITAEASANGVNNMVKKKEKAEAGMTDKDEPSDQELQIRENFEKTAFFFPSLVTDEKGVATLSFTLPESVTTWCLKAIANDVEMNNGSISEEVLAQKTIMVQTNMPRFLRAGDRTSLVARVANTSEKNLDGTATITLSDAVSGKTLLQEKRNFTVKAGGTSPVSFNIIAPEDCSMLVCRMVAETSEGSDGEQDYLAVLSGKEMVMNTLAFTLTEKGSHTIDIASLTDARVADNTVTVEVTNNPSWLVVEALPAMAEVKCDNVFSLVSALYANTIAHTLLLSQKNIKAMMTMWQNDKTQASPLASTLEKKESLRQMLLDESPWTLNSRDDASRKQQLSRYFNTQQVTLLQGDNVRHLKNLQNGDGSWSWMKGMEGSRYATASAVKTLARLQYITSSVAGTIVSSNNNSSSSASALFGKDVETMLRKGATYLAGKLVEDVEKYKQDKKKHGNSAWLYIDDDALYALSLMNYSFSARQKSAVDFLLSELIRNKKSQSLYSKAVTAVILARQGQKAEAGKYMESLRQYLVQTPEMGAYYSSPRALYSWCDYRIPTQVAALEAIRMIAPEDKSTIAAMQLWLLQCKRTQSWDTPINAVDAIWAFMQDNADVLSDNSHMTVKMDGRQLSDDNATAGEGYVSTVITNTHPREIEIEKPTGNLSWGAVHASFLQNATDVETSVSGIVVKRELLDDNGKVITSIKNNSKNGGVSLRVGQKVKVRITVKADRDYDFVSVSDRRAACLEPVEQLSGYRRGCYVTPRDNTTNYYFDRLSKGTHVLETEYFVDRNGAFTSGTCIAECMYAPEYSGRDKAMVIVVEP